MLRFKNNRIKELEFTLCVLVYTVLPHAVCVCNVYSYVHIIWTDKSFV